MNAAMKGRNPGQLSSRRSQLAPQLEACVEPIPKVLKRELRQRFPGPAGE